MPLVDDLHTKVGRQDVEDMLGNAIRRKAEVYDIEFLNNKMTTEMSEIEHKLTSMEA